MNKSNRIDKLNLHSGIVPYKQSNIIINEEALTNTTLWGDSLLGRLINSGVRKAKIGYNQTKVANLLEAFKRELDGIISASLSRDTKKEYNTLLIKSLFDEIQKTCTDDIEDEKKLDNLLGGHLDLWDPAKQDGGMWKNIINSGLLFEVYNTIDKDMDEEDLKKANVSKDALLDNISIFIDNLRKMTVDSTTSTSNVQTRSNFRVNFGNLVNSLSRVNASYEFLFDVDFINEDVIRFDEFIFEEAPKTDKLVEPVKGGAPVKPVKGGAPVKPVKGGAPAEPVKVEEPKKEDKPSSKPGVGSLIPGNEYSYTNKKGEKKQVKVISLTHQVTSGGDKTWLTKDDTKKDTLGKGEVSVIFKDEKGAFSSGSPQMSVPISSISTNVSQSTSADPAGATTRDRILKLIKLAKDCKDKEFDSPENAIADKSGLAFIKQASCLTSDDISYLFTKSKGIKAEVDGDELPISQALDTVISEPAFDPIQKQFKTTGIRSKDSNKQVFNNKLYTKEMKIKEFSNRLAYNRDKLLKKNPNNEDAKTAVTELTKYLKSLGAEPKVSPEPPKASKVKESFNFNSEYFLTFNELTGQGTQSGTQSGNAAPKPRTVEDEYNESFDKVPDLYKGGITQNEVDKLNKLMSGKGTKDMVLDLSKNPDPIIAIIRVFSRAHDLYYTDYIPSGRTGGKVSNKTMREYTPLGKNGGGTPDEPKGPFAVKSILSKWTDGVMQILEDQKYRKILANIKFVVAGAEDTFNKESVVLKLSDFRLILEGSEDKDSDPTGEGKKSQGQILFDFINSMLDKETIADFDTQKRKLLRKYFGQSVPEEKIESTASTRTVNRPIGKDDKEAKTLIWKKCEDTKFKTGSFYAIPVKKSGPQRDHEFIFLQTIRMEGGRMLVKFTFNRPLIVKEYKDDKYPGYTIPTDWTIPVGGTKTVYYALMPDKLPGSGGKLKMVYANVNQGNTPGWGGDVYFSEFDVDWTNKPNINNVSTAKLVQIDENKVEKKIENVDFEKRVLSEKNKHDDSLSLKSLADNTKILKEELKKKADSNLTP